MNILYDKVLLLNRLMQPLRLITVRRAFFLLTKPRKTNPSSRVATALEVDENHAIVGPVQWEDWLTREVRPGDRAISSAKQKIRVPSIIVLAEYDKVPVVEPTLSKSSLWERQNGKDMYTLEQLAWDDCDVEHYIAKSRGGATSWTNCGVTAIKHNRKKGDRAAHEVGLRLRLPLTVPRPKPVLARLRRDPRFPEWNPFIRKDPQPVV